MSGLRLRLSAFKSLEMASIACGIALRFLVALRGHNYDFESFTIVAQAVTAGNNVYATTARYNYGPIWFRILGAIYWLAAGNLGIFRALLVGFLTTVDLMLCWVMYRKIGPVAAFLMFLSPISIIITGYHNQFDNLALLIGLCAVLLIRDESKGAVSPRMVGGLFLLGLSLTTKHLLFLFPLWLAVKQTGIRRAFIVITVPLLIFALSFIPYWSTGHTGIVQNVMLYSSFNNNLFYRAFVPGASATSTVGRFIWMAVLGISGIIFRKRDNFGTLLLYTGVLVAASPAFTNQYLVIPLCMLVANMGPFAIAYYILASLFLVAADEGLHYSGLQQAMHAYPGSSTALYYAVLATLLTLVLLTALWRKEFSPLRARLRGLANIGSPGSSIR